MAADVIALSFTANNRPERIHAPSLAPRKLVGLIRANDNRTNEPGYSLLGQTFLKNNYNFFEIPRRQTAEFNVTNKSVLEFL